MREGRGQKGTVSVWVNVARAVNARFGPTWLANEIAIIGASSPNLRPGGDVNSTAPPFGVGSDVGILVREIRSNASKTSWWRQETASLTTEIDVATWALALASVAAEETVEACVSLLGELLSQLSDTRVGALLLSAARLGMSTAARKISSDIVVAASAASERAASLLTPYISLVAHFDISERIDPPTLVAMAKHGPASWAVTWPVVQAYRGDLKEQDILRAAGASAYVPDEAIPPAADKEPDWSAPLADPATYPWNFIEAIDRLLEGQRELPSLLSESTRDNWFEEED